MNNAANGIMNTNLGNVQIDNDVIAKYAGSSAVECFGIVGMASVNVKDGLARLLKRDSLKHGVGVTVSEENKITIDLHIIVSYGVSISAVADNLIGNVKYKIEEFAGLPVEKINVFVEGVRVID
ncbi:MAG: Asp23/Gls24 family envelope stress response protein [Lachnospiraceae bacterium]